jgi:hypothetical protein
MLKAKLHETRQCPSCGWLMRLQIDPESVRELVRVSELPPELRRHYECANKACEYVERAA